VNSAEWVFLGLAGAYVVLALYGKYRRIKEDFLEAREAEAAMRRTEEEPGPRE
jgi:hypothetical protein